MTMPQSLYAIQRQALQMAADMGEQAERMAYPVSARRHLASAQSKLNDAAARIGAAQVAFEEAIDAMTAVSDAT